MKRYILLLLIVVAIHGQSYAQNKFSISVAPELLYSNGYTEYELQASGMTDFPEINDTLFAEIRSLLEFPLDAPMVGICFRMNSRILQKKDWGLKARVLTNIANPSGVMKDHDWIKVSSLNVDHKFSYTESDTEMRSVFVEFEGTRVVSRQNNTDLSVLAVVSFQHSNQDIIGVSGWQFAEILDPATKQYFPENSYVGKVLEYRINNLMLQLGGEANINARTWLDIGAKGALAIARISERDDHLLRKKLIEATSSGFGFVGGVNAHFSTAGDNDVGRFINLSFEVIHVNTSGTQKQTWYDDETVGSVVVMDRGTVINGLQHKTSSTQLRFGVQFGVWLK